MKAIVAAAAIYLVLAPQPAPASQKSADADQQNPHPNAKVAKSSPVAIKQSPAQQPTNQNRKTVDASQNERTIRVVSLPPRSTGDTIALICTVVLTFVGLGGIFAAVRTLRAIRRQTDAMVASERAWVIAELIPKPFETMDEDLTYHLRLTNMGRTPAFVTKYTISSLRANERGILQRGLLAFDFPNRPLGGGGQLTFDDHPINVTDHIEAGNDSLLFLGSVTYQHVFDRTEFVKESFCYAFDAETRTLRRVATPDPNEHQEQTPN